MPSSDIDIFSDVAISVDSPHAKRIEQGITTQKAIASIAAATASGSDVGMIRFQKGFNLDHFSLVSDDLDSATNVTLDVGFIYDDSTLTDDPNAFLDGLDIVQDAGSRTWPVDDGLLTGIGFEAEGAGFLTVTIADANTTTLGDITMIAAFTYDN